MYILLFIFSSASSALALKVLLDIRGNGFRWSFASLLAVLCISGVLSSVNFLMLNWGIQVHWYTDVTRTFSWCGIMVSLASMIYFAKRHNK